MQVVGNGCCILGVSIPSEAHHPPDELLRVYGSGFGVWSVGVKVQCFESRVGVNLLGGEVAVGTGRAHLIPRAKHFRLKAPVRREAAV